ncbi:NAD(P)-binding protein [Diplogelasinospora grovesii]|uniref:NAD(P)-binding protein n=1 Tax=Diplogelasinospora grovesii TaxID=303347 RepID=A0AAN6MXI9_9PEZI|nr:NAD(P)-binding protein [Diplogelasinospora grovesii]
MKTIGIFPASGGLGGSTYRHLLKMVPNDHVILISRHPDKIQAEYNEAGFQLRQASYESSPSELEASFAGIDTLFLISYPSHVRDYRVKVQLPAVDAARRAGVKHVSYSSLGFAGPEDSNQSVAEVMQAHLETEKYLAKLAAEDPRFTYTSIREGIYSESTPIYTAFFIPKQSEESEILIPHDGSGPGVAWVKRDELGEASARLIANYATNPNSFPHVNAKVLLTGTRVWTLSDTVKILGEIAGRTLTIRPISVDEYVKLPQVLGNFGSEEKARTWATAWDAIRAGETAVVTPRMEEILGRKPEEFDVTVKKHWQLA